LVQNKRRAGFTLVEMLVALGIVLLIASLIVAFGPGFQKTEKAARGADLLQRWLLVAKQRARKDGIPRGLHLFIDTTTTPPVVRTLQYIEQPVPYTRGQVTTTPPSTASINVDITDGIPIANSALWPVQPGDFLQVGNPVALPVCRIATITPVVGPPASTTITTAFANIPAVTGAPYMIYRAARPTQGEPPLDLPQGVIIDPSVSLPAFATGLDILFLPSGGVRHTGFASNKLILWVRDIDDTTPGVQHTLVTIYTNTGLIAAHPFGTVADPYLYTRDGRSSGL
jgi:prepilin-type N-terminal cleavage/methylation domain-containing protein